MGLWNWLFGGRANELATPTSPLEPPASAGPAWQSSENGNPTTILGRIRLTVFPQDNGWKFCIANVDDRGEPHFSDVYASEAAAREEALAAVRGEPSRHRPLWVDGAENRRRRMEAELDARAATIEDLRAWLSGNPDAGISALRKPELKIRSQLRQLDWHVGELERLGASASVVTGAREQSRILSDLAGEVAARLAATSRTTPESPLGRSRTSTPCMRTSTRSTRSCAIRACSAGTARPTAGRAQQRLARLVLGDVVLLGARRAPCADDDLRLQKHAAQLVDDRGLDLCRRHTPNRAGIRPLLQHVLADVVAVEPIALASVRGGRRRVRRPLPVARTPPRRSSSSCATRRRSLARRRRLTSGSAA